MNSSIKYFVTHAALSTVSVILPVQSFAQSACAEYVLCLCDFAEQNSDEDPNSAVTCEQTRQMYAALTTPESEQVCRESFDAIKRMYRQMAPLYASQGIVVPGSCR